MLRSPRLRPDFFFLGKIKKKTIQNQDLLLAWQSDIRYLGPPSIWDREKAICGLSITTLISPALRV